MMSWNALLNVEQYLWTAYAPYPRADMYVYFFTINYIFTVLFNGNRIFQ